MKVLIYILILIFTFSCQNGKRNEKTAPGKLNMDTLMQMNINLIKKDIVKIQDYISRSGREMTETGTGLFYEFIRDEEGENAAIGQEVYFSYRISSLDGDQVYSSEILGPRHFEIEKSDVEAGWNEAAKLLSPGDSLIAILPPHLAFRNIGDGNLIGPGQVLIYELRLDSVR